MFVVPDLVVYTTLEDLDGLWIESLWGRIFCTHPDRLSGPLSILCNGYGVSLLGLKRPGRGVDHPASSSVEVKEKV